MGSRVLRRVLRRGSKKGLSRRHLEGRNTPFREYAPVGVRPTLNHANTPENVKTQSKVRAEENGVFSVRWVPGCSGKESSLKP